MARIKSNGSKDRSGNLGFEAKLWLAADQHRNNADAAEYNHVVLASNKRRIYDPCCGSEGMFVRSETFIEAHGGKPDQVAIYGQESNATTRRLAVMNLAIRGITADFRPKHADTFRRDLHPDLRADYVLANCSMSSKQSGEGDIRRALIEADLVVCMVAIPGHVFYNTQIPEMFQKAA